MNETCRGMTKTKPLLVLQRGHGVHLFLCFQGGRVDQGDPGGQEVQQVQLDLGHPEQNKTKHNKTQRQGKKTKCHTFYQSKQKIIIGAVFTLEKLQISAIFNVTCGLKATHQYQYTLLSI